MTTLRHNRLEHVAPRLSALLHRPRARTPSPSRRSVVSDMRPVGRVRAPTAVCQRATDLNPMVGRALYLWPHSHSHTVHVAAASDPATTPATNAIQSAHGHDEPEAPTRPFVSRDAQRLHQHAHELCQGSPGVTVPQHQHQHQLQLTSLPKPRLAQSFTFMQSSSGELSKSASRATAHARDTVKRLTHSPVVTFPCSGLLQPMLTSRVTQSRAPTAAVLAWTKGPLDGGDSSSLNHGGRTGRTYILVCHVEAHAS